MQIKYEVEYDELFDILTFKCGNQKLTLPLYKGTVSIKPRAENSIHVKQPCLKETAGFFGFIIFFYPTHIHICYP